MVSRCLSFRVSRVLSFLSIVPVFIFVFDLLYAPIEIYPARLGTGPLAKYVQLSEGGAGP